jgi:hypothetical protein
MGIPFAKFVYSTSLSRLQRSIRSFVSRLLLWPSSLLLHFCRGSKSGKTEEAGPPDPFGKIHLPARDQPRVDVPIERTFVGASHKQRNPSLGTNST